MDRLTSMNVFSRVAAARSFSTAARELGISQATASKHVQMLERWLGLRLLDRTTRRVDLTEDGSAFFARCVRILEEIDAIRPSEKGPAALFGTIVMTIPPDFAGNRLGPALTDFLAQHPTVSLDVRVTDRPTDVWENGRDLVLAVLPHEAAPMNARRLLGVPRIACAAPDYLTQHPAPTIPADLSGHDCIGDAPGTDAIWRFTGPDGEEENVAVNFRLRTGNEALQMDAARAGAGVALVSESAVATEIAAGRLVRLLPGHVVADAALYALWPADHMLSVKARKLLDHLTSRLNEGSAGRAARPGSLD
jgi:DNA-binding transcriptional LysR family regulator